MVNIGVLISGSGTNLQAIIDAIDKGLIKGNIKVIISNRKDAYGLERGKKANIESIFIDPKGYSNEEYGRILVQELKKRDVELVVLAGFLKILSKDFIAAYRNQIINIHPSLIPSFCGKGYYGEKVHRAVLDYGVKYTGATVHFVDEGADTGPITLREKVLRIEHKILVEAIRLYCEGKITIEGRKVIINRE